MGPRTFRMSRNLKSAKQNPDILDEKIAIEVQAGRVGGPFRLDNLPFPNLQISPLGLVPKQKPGDYRVIHHLSFPEGSSINDGISREHSTVSYQSVDDAVALIKHYGKGALLSKTDIEHGYKNIPIHPNDYELLGFAVGDDLYYDKTLPMGLSFACNLFEKFSSAMHWVINNKLQIAGCVHLLDDFLLVGPPLLNICSQQLQLVLDLFAHIGMPIKSEKTVLPTTVLTFLGLELDSVHMLVRLPDDKLHKVRSQLQMAIRRKKMTLRELQQLIGLMNFVCAVVVPGRTFLRRLIDLTLGLTKPHHRKRLGKDAKLDIEAWLLFIEHFNGKSMFLADQWSTSDSLQLYTDASGVGFGGVFGKKWFFGQWSELWTKHHISVKELLPIVVAVETWGSDLQNKKIYFYSDNMAVVQVINKQTAKDPHIMKLLRRLVVQCLKCNILFRARHIPGVDNVLSDRLSRLQIQEFREVAPYMDLNPTQVSLDQFSI